MTTSPENRVVQNIAPKYAVGETVIINSCHRNKEAVIYEIDIKVNNEGTRIKYRVRTSPLMMGSIGFNEEDLEPLCS